MAPPEERAQPPPNFWPISIVAKRLGGSRCNWYGGKPGPRRRYARWVAAPHKRHSPQFSSHVYCGQRDGWVKTALRTEVDLGRGHIVLDGEPAPREKGTAAPSSFSAHGHGHPSQVLLSSCADGRPVTVHKGNSVTE